MANGFLLTDAEAVEKLLDEFGRGYAVELPYANSDGRALAVWFIPGTAFSMGSERRLIIAVQGHGVIEVAEPQALDEFILASSGIPLVVAQHVARVIRAMVSEVRRRRAERSTVNRIEDHTNGN